MKDVHSVLNQWPSFEIIARDCKVTKDAVWQWVKRQRIPPVRFPDLIDSGKRHGIKISYDQLIQVNASQRATA